MSFDEENHPSICKIKENMIPELSFNFSETEEHKVGKIIDKLQVKKATGAALTLVDVLGVFTSEIGFCTPKIRRSDVL